MSSSVEAVGLRFDLEKLQKAQIRTLKLLNALSALIQAGMTEQEATEIYKKLQLESGAEKYWHPPKIRFGCNTLCAFREPSVPDVRLQENDIFFLDLGPIYDDHEGDVGRTYVVGTYPAAEKVKACCESIYQATKEQFLQHKMTGVELYQFAEQLAQSSGYELVGEGAKGHRISEFPHAVHYRANLKEWGERPPATNRWILEIQIRDRANQIGAFYEDLV